MLIKKENRITVIARVHAKGGKKCSINGRAAIQCTVTNIRKQHQSLQYTKQHHTELTLATTTELPSAPNKDSSLPAFGNDTDLLNLSECPKSGALWNVVFCLNWLEVDSLWEIVSWKKVNLCKNLQRKAALTKHPTAHRRLNEIWLSSASLSPMKQTPGKEFINILLWAHHTHRTISFSFQSVLAAP